MLAAGLMNLLWPGPDTPSQRYPQLTEEDLPGIQWCFFGNLRLPPTNTARCPGAEMDPLWITHLPAHPRRLQDAATHHR